MRFILIFPFLEDDYCDNAKDEYCGGYDDDKDDGVTLYLDLGSASVAEAVTVVISVLTRNKGCLTASAFGGAGICILMSEGLTLGSNAILTGVGIGAGGLEPAVILGLAESLVTALALTGFGCGAGRVGVIVSKRLYGLCIGSCRSGACLVSKESAT